MLRLFPCIAFVIFTIFAGYAEAKKEGDTQKQIDKAVAAINAIINKSYPFLVQVSADGPGCTSEKMIFDVENSGNAVILMTKKCGSTGKLSRVSFNFKDIEKGTQPPSSINIYGGSSTSGQAFILYPCVDFKKCVVESSTGWPDDNVSSVHLTFPDRPKIIAEFQQEFEKLIALFKKK